MKQLLFMFLAVTGCATQPSPQAASAPLPLVVPTAPPSTSSNVPLGHSPDFFRVNPPDPEGTISFQPPSIHSFTLTNGIRVLLIERHELPIVGLSVSIRRGAEEGFPGVGGFVGAMLLQGTKTRSALALSDALENIGASYDVNVTYDEITFQGKCLNDRFSEFLSVASDIFQNPSFEQAEIERVRSKRLTALAQQNDQPSIILSNKVNSILFSTTSPYAESLLGTETMLRAVRSADLVQFYRQIFSPSQTTISVAGDISEETLRTKLEKTFAQWPMKPVPHAYRTSPWLLATRTKAAAPTAAPESRVFIVDRPNATQSYVALAWVGAERRSPDYDKILVTNAIFGGKFSSRLNMNLREKNAYTYGARSQFMMRHLAGPVSAGGAIVQEHTGDAIKEMLFEIKRLQTEPVNDQELAETKDKLILELPARFESVSDTAFSLSTLAVYDLPLDEYSTRNQRIAKVTKADIQEIANKYFNVSNIKIIVVGDAKKVEPQIKGLNLGIVQVQ